MEYRAFFSSAERFRTEFREFSVPRIGSEENSESLLRFLFRGREFRAFFSAERFGTEFREFSIPRNCRNSAGTNQLFRLFRPLRNNFFFLKLPTLIRAFDSQCQSRNCGSIQHPPTQWNLRGGRSSSVELEKISLFGQFLRLKYWLCLPNPNTYYHPTEFEKWGKHIYCVYIMGCGLSQKGFDYG